VSFKVAALAVLLALTFGIFSQTSDHEFLYFDDPQYVTENPHVKEGLTTENFLWAFSTTHFSNWHPLTWLSHMFDVELFGLSPRAHHLVSVLFHVLNVGLLFLVLNQLTGAPGRSAFVAALFAIHPLHVESVAWVAERKDVLSTLFGLLMLWAYGRYAAKPRIKRYLLVGAFFILSLLSKPMWVTAPFLLLLLDLWPLQRMKDSPLEFDPACPPKPQFSLIRLVTEKAPLLLLSAASSVITVVAQSRGGALYSLERLGWGTRIGNAIIAYLHYLGKTFWPSSLAAYYPQTEAAPSAWQVFGSALLLLGITLFALRQVRKMPWLVVGWFWFLGTLIPVIGLVQVGSQAIADRYTYLPIIGIFIAVSWCAVWVSRRSPWVKVSIRVAAVLIVALLSVITFRQIGYWRDHETLFRHTIAVTENNSRAHHILSQGLAVKGNFKEALFHAREAVRLDPNNPRTHKNFGYMLYQVGRIDEAILEFQRAIALQPDYAEAHGNLAIAYRKKGWTDLARQEMLLEKKLRTAQPGP
jgi:tetratricopeptide (TPR) repeat protein